MKFTDFDFSLTRADNNATLYFKTDLYLYMDSVFSKYIDQTPASWDDIMDRMRYALGKEPDGVDAQLSIVYMFDDTMKIVLTMCATSSSGRRTLRRKYERKRNRNRA